MKATHTQSPPVTGTPLRDGTPVTSLLRGSAVGVVRGEPFGEDGGGDRRRKVWVDYTRSTGVKAIDYVRDLRVAP